MANLYVAKDGDNSDGSTWAKAFTAIGSAVTASSNGDTIYVGAGTYSETVNLDTANKSVVIDGIDKTAIIARTATFGDSGKCVLMENSSTVKNFTLTSNYQGIFIAAGKTAIVISNCDIHARLDSIFSGAISAVISNCILSSHYDVIIAGGGTTGYTINNCTFYSDGNDGSTNTIYGVKAVDGCRATIGNCSFLFERVAGSTGTVMAIYSGVLANVSVFNCSISTSTLGGGDVYDLYNDSGTMNVLYSDYNIAKAYNTTTVPATGIILAAPGTGRSIQITGISLVSATTQNITLTDGTDTLLGPIYLTENVPVQLNLPHTLKVGANKPLHQLISGSGATTVKIWGYIDS